MRGAGGSTASSQRVVGGAIVLDTVAMTGVRRRNLRATMNQYDRRGGHHHHAPRDRARLNPRVG
jgi:hypothetical protein